MPRPMCPLCTSDDEVTILEVLPDGRKRARCAACKFEWDHGEVKEPKKLQIMSEVEARGRFPRRRRMFDLEVMERAETLKARFLAELRQQPDPRIPIFWAKYQHAFQPRGPADLRPRGAQGFRQRPHRRVRRQDDRLQQRLERPGRTAEASKQTRQVIDYLLRRDGPITGRASHRSHQWRVRILYHWLQGSATDEGAVDHAPRQVPHDRHVRPEGRDGASCLPGSNSRRRTASHGRSAASLCGATTCSTN